ncbi:unnamed protein product [Aureobasidium vineae]|uniref:Mediator of RNA polymerase II transcription subunit 10 n=1 Tax=Aureobasidium vineae TaxID=2773715 RepID=A0A9N8JLF1_9PEZI|nr:unnamed protein product [Aureobasidium vineae]
MASTDGLDQVEGESLAYLICFPLLTVPTEQLKAVIDNLYMLICQAHEFRGSQTTEAMTFEILPPEVIEYVERSRNPDIYTREFVELVQRLNQQLKGRSQAFADFRDILAREMAGALPDCKQDITMVVESTGGKAPA